eukprot:6195223-Pleurochrysis_carterae.AAC.6
MEADFSKLCPLFASKGSSELVIRYEPGRESATLLSFAAAQPPPASTATAHSDKKMDRRAGCELVLLEDELEGVNRQISDGHAQQQEQDKALSLKQHDAIKHLAEGRQVRRPTRHSFRPCIVVSSCGRSVA